MEHFFREKIQETFLSGGCGCGDGSGNRAVGKFYILLSFFCVCVFYINYLCLGTLIRLRLLYILFSLPRLTCLFFFLLLLSLL
ncbi:hypothetical protein F5X96DRAFT_624204, partial [Biscogniauxia mediterranea]